MRLNIFIQKDRLPLRTRSRLRKKLREQLPLSDKQDFEEVKKGFIAAPEYKQIKNTKGGVAWDFGKFDFLTQGQDFGSIHPSLQR